MRRLLLSTIRIGVALTIGAAIGATAACSDEDPVDVCQVTFDCIIEAGCVEDLQLRADLRECTDVYGWDSPECASLQEARTADAMAALECSQACAEPEWLDDGNTEVQTEAETSYNRAFETATRNCNVLSMYGESSLLSDEEKAAASDRCAAACDYDCPGTYC